MPNSLIVKPIDVENVLEYCKKHNIVLDASGWLNEPYPFNEIIEEIKPKRIIEVGTWKGKSAFLMLEKAKQFNPNVKIICVDTWLGNVEIMMKTVGAPGFFDYMENNYPEGLYYQFLFNVIQKGYLDSIIPLRQTSLNACEILRCRAIKADLIYIDGSHEYEAISCDLRTYIRLLSPNGVMICDDYCWDGVHRAIDEFATKNPQYERTLFNDIYVIFRNKQG